MCTIRRDEYSMVYGIRHKTGWITVRLSDMGFMLTGYQTDKPLGDTIDRSAIPDQVDRAAWRYINDTLSK